MAYAQEYPLVHANGPGHVYLNFRFQINGTSDPDNIVPANQGVTDIVRTSTGLFTITLANKYPTLVNCVAMLQAASATGTTPELVSYTASTGVLIIRCIGQDGTPAVADPSDNDWVHVSAVFEKYQNLAPSGSI